jgi:hypothetical protein
VRLVVLLAIAACRGDPAAPPRPRPAPRAVVRDAAPASTLPAARAYPDLAAALRATIPDDARVIGFGELHARTDRANVTSALARFTAGGLPAIADRLSDLVIETWITDPHCGQTAQAATAKVMTAMHRPAQTSDQIGALAQAARARGIQPRAMQLSCADYARIAPAGKDVDAEAMLTLTTRELGRAARDAVTARDREPSHRPWIAVYGGALHNDRFPDASVAEWSYAAQVDHATGGHFVEIDLIVPEFAEGDPVSQKQPWFPLVGAAGSGSGVRVWQRGERSYVVILPRATP